MDPELIHSMENLQFTAAETESVVVEPPCEVGDSGLWLAGSVISSKAVNGDSICRIFRSVWKSKKVSEILELRPNFFLIKPVEKAAMEMILKRRPWTVHDDLFSIEPYNPEWRAADFNFTGMVIWERVYQLPLRAMNGTMGLNLGGTLVRAIGVDHRVEGGNLGEFLRIRVSIDITKPLRRCVMLGNGQGQKPSPCPLKYERLPRFCYFCGLLGHDLATCSTKPTDLDIRKLQYGSWLRVTVQKPLAGSQKKQGIEYFASNGEVAVDSGGYEGETPPAGSRHTAGSNSAEKVGVMDEVAVDESSGSRVGASNDTSPPVTASTKVGYASPTPAGTEGSACAAGTFSCSTTVEPNATVDPLVPKHVDAGAVLDGCQPVDAGAVLDGCHVDEVPNPVLPIADTELVAFKQAAENVAPLLSKPLVNNSKPLLPKQIVGSTEPGLPKLLIDDIEPVLPKQAVVMENSAMGVSLTRAKRSLQGKYESKLFDGGCRGCRATPSSIMKILSWNCRGLGSPAMVQSLGSFIAQHDSDLVFLCETRLKQSSNSRIQHALIMNGCFVVDYGNGCTGLMILWNRKINVSLLSYSSIHINVNVASDSGSFHFSGLHGHCVDKNKHLTWSTIDRLRSSSALPWLVGGDINEILCHSEKEGGRRKLPGFLDTFRDCLDRNHLIDCKPISGWSALATTDWFTLFPDYRVSSFYTAKSDHCFLLMDNTQAVSVKSGTRDYFRFDSCWSNEVACIERVRSSWLHSSGSTGTITDETKMAFLEAKREHKSLLDKDEAYWTQRARVTWLTQGDINPTKAPGIDGLPGSFFRQHWELIGPDILRLCHDILTRKIDMSCVNATVITLIPKVEDPVRMQQLRPISLCTIVYKIVSNTILNCIKPFLPGCISENQSAFLKNRLISDNILVTNELLHYICSSKNGPNKGAALKLDMEKAFDRVE
ncbi:hypothetical protein GQ457_12G013540 [Hibiscus cannabinus]